MFLRLFFILTVTAIILSCGKRHNAKWAFTVSEEIMIDTGTGACPFLTKDNDGRIVLSWIKRFDSSKSMVCYVISADGGRTFGKTMQIPGSTNVHPHGENMPKIIFKPGGEIVAAWGAA